MSTMGAGPGPVVWLGAVLVTVIVLCSAVGVFSSKVRRVVFGHDRADEGRGSVRFAVLGVGVLTALLVMGLAWSSYAIAGLLFGGSTAIVLGPWTIRMYDVMVFGVGPFSMLLVTAVFGMGALPRFGQWQRERERMEETR